MSTSASEVIPAIYATLSSGVDARALATGGIYSLNDVPDDAQPDYIVVGEISEIAANTFDKRGQESLLMVHLWSDHRGHDRILALHDAIYDALDRASLTLTDHRSLACTFDNSNLMEDNTSGEKLLHMVDRYRIYTQEIP